MSQSLIATLVAVVRTITIGARGYSKVVEQSIDTLELVFGVPVEEAAERAIPAQHFRDNIDAFVAKTRYKSLKADYAAAVDLDACIYYSGELTLDGYASTRVRKEAFEYFKDAAVEEGYQLDHACCNPSYCKGGADDPHRSCVNASHFHEMKQEQNVQLNGNNSGLSVSKPKPVRVIGGTCKKGHEMTEENVREDGKCRACNNAQQERYRVKRREVKKVKDRDKFIKENGQGYDFSDWEMFG
jgi:hypothetical protein